MILVVKNAQLAIRSGITSMRDLGSKGFLTVSVREAVDRGIIPGPRIVSCGVALTITGGQSYYKAMVADTADEMKKAARELIHGGAHCVKIFGSGGNATPGSNPLASQYSLEEFQAATDEAHRLGKHLGQPPCIPPRPSGWRWKRGSTAWSTAPGSGPEAWA